MKKKFVILFFGLINIRINYAKTISSTFFISLYILVFIYFRCQCYGKLKKKDLYELKYYITHWRWLSLSQVFFKNCFVSDHKNTGQLMFPFYIRAVLYKHTLLKWIAIHLLEYLGLVISICILYLVKSWIDIRNIQNRPTFILHFECSTFIFCSFLNPVLLSQLTVTIDICKSIVESYTRQLSFNLFPVKSVLLSQILDNSVFIDNSKRIVKWNISFQ